VTVITPFLRHLNTGTLAIFLFVALASLTSIRGREVETKGSTPVEADKNEIAIADFSFSPKMFTVPPGATVTWINNGLQSHTIAAQDGSWTTGPITPSDQVSLKFDKPGTYTYIDKEHPWMYGQLLVVAANAAPNGVFTAQQVGRGKALYNQSCAGCHLEDGSGRIGSSLIDNQFNHPRANTDVGLFEVIWAGGSGAMQPFAGRIPADSMLKIIAYINSLPKKR